MRLAQLSGSRPRAFSPSITEKEGRRAAGVKALNFQTETLPLGEATRTIVEGKSGYPIDGGSGFSIRYPNKAAAQAQIDRLERAEHEAEEDHIANHIARLAAAHEYLAREASTPTQLTLF